jgi:hypothetical protein
MTECFRDEGRGNGAMSVQKLLICYGQAFWKTVLEGRHMMPPLKDALTEQQIADIQAWLKTLP